MIRNELHLDDRKSAVLDVELARSTSSRMVSCQVRGEILKHNQLISYIPRITKGFWCKQARLDPFFVEFDPFLQEQRSK